MDPVRASTSSSTASTRPSLACVDASTSAGSSGAGCVGSIITLLTTAPTGWALLVTGMGAATACGMTGWNTAKAVDRCSSDEGTGAAPTSGQDGVDHVEDHRNDAANAPWRRGVVIEPLERELVCR